MTDDEKSSYSEQSPTPASSEFASPKLNQEQLRYVVLDCLDARKAHPEIRAKLIALGLSKKEAERFIESVVEEQRRTGTHVEPEWRMTTRNVALPEIEKPIITAKPSGNVEADVPQGDDLCKYIFFCLRRGSHQADIIKQMVAFGYSRDDAEKVVTQVAEWRLRTIPKSLDERLGDCAREILPGCNGTMLVGCAIGLPAVIISVLTCMYQYEDIRVIYAWGFAVVGFIVFSIGFFTPTTKR